MGIYDRDYYRESARRPLDGRVQAYVVLIVVYVAIYIAQIGTREVDRFRKPLPGPVTEALVLKADKVLEGEVWRVVTFAFAHDPMNPAPIAFNIVFLIFFCRFVEDIFGWKEFLAFYLLAGLLSGLGFVLAASVVQAGGELVGPQCSITAVLLLMALQNPRRTILLFFTIPCPIWFVVAFNVLLDVVGYFGGKVHPLVLAAHGFAASFALLYFRYQWTITNWLPSWSGRAPRTKARPGLQIYRDESTADREPAPATTGGTLSSSGGTAPASAPATATASATMDEQLEAKLDEVLDKVKKYGQENLTEEERAVLFRASEIYRKRRKS